MKNTGLSALLAAALLAGGMSYGANAADFGGDCCADLEERIAELEATTARKGNRKVSLTVSGFVAQQVLFWDDGFEDNVYVTDTGSVSIGTNVSFSGNAKINSEWSAGFAIKLELINADSLLVNQNSDDGNIGLGGSGAALATLQGNGSDAVALESAYWFLKSERLGRLSVGQQSSAVDNQAIIVDGSGSLVQANYVLYDSNAFAIRNSAGGATTNWGSLGNCQTLNAYGGAAADCDGVPHNNVRYDTPTYKGFGASFSWGEDDIWGASIRYAGSMRDFKVAVAAAYVHSSDEGGTGLVTNAGASANGGLDVAAFQVGAYAMHTPTGLFVYGAYGTEDNETTSSVRDAGQTNPDHDVWYLKAGLRRKFVPLGHTVFYGEYGQKDDAFTAGLYDEGVNSTELTHWGVGVVQEIDAAAMSVWMAYRGYDADVTCDAAIGGCATFGDGNADLEELHLFKMGALIAF
ncbi:MAG: porin [Pseudomonadota bacterium]